MAKTKDKIKVSILLPTDIYNKLLEDSEKENRSLSSQGALIIQKYYEKEN